MATVLVRMVAWLACLALLAPSVGVAHEVRPTIVTADLSQPGRLTLDLSANLEALMAGIGIEHRDTDEAPGAARYKTLRALPPHELRAEFERFAPRWLKDLGISADGAAVPVGVEAVMIPDAADQSRARISTLRLAGPLPETANALRFAFPAQYGSSVLRVKRAGASELETNWLKDGAASADVPMRAEAPRGWFGTLVEYVGVGFTHILPKGLDHILFVLGLFFLSPQLKPLLVQVTAFTVAHTITLALGLFGVIELSPRIVEPLIAASIVFIAVENILTNQLTAWRPFVVFVFGLLHGLGFAGVLQEFGLPPDRYVSALVGFNVGVELGQIAVILLAWFATTYWFGKEAWYRQRVVVPVSLAIAAVGLFWTVERVWFA